MHSSTYLLLSNGDGEPFLVKFQKSNGEPFIKRNHDSEYTDQGLRFKRNYPLALRTMSPGIFKSKHQYNSAGITFVFFLFI